MSRNNRISLSLSCNHRVSNDPLKKHRAHSQVTRDFDDEAKRLGMYPVCEYPSATSVSCNQTEGLKISKNLFFTNLILTEPLITFVPNHREIQITRVILVSRTWRKERHALPAQWHGPNCQCSMESTCSELFSLSLSVCCISSSHLLVDERDHTEQSEAREKRRGNCPAVCWQGVYNNY